MSTLHLLRIGDVQPLDLEGLREDLAAAFRVRCEVLPASLDSQFAFHPERQQYHSTELLGRLGHFRQPDTWRLLGIAAVDLYIPILTFVFGEAQLGDSCAVVSLHRLRQEIYGLPPDAAVLRQRLLKECVHELGHTLELAHCEDYRCVMAPSHAVEWIDLKESLFCDECRARLAQTASRTP
jgi:archaemetzincin